MKISKTGKKSYDAENKIGYYDEYLRDRRRERRGRESQEESECWKHECDENLNDQTKMIEKVKQTNKEKSFVHSYVHCVNYL